MSALAADSRSLVHCGCDSCIFLRMVAASASIIPYLGYNYMCMFLLWLAFLMIVVGSYAAVYSFLYMQHIRAWEVGEDGASWLTGQDDESALVWNIVTILHLSVCHTC